MKQRGARQSVEKWARMITRFEKSGLSPVEFYQQEDLSLATFSRWRSRSATLPSEYASYPIRLYRRKASAYRVTAAQPGVIDSATNRPVHYPHHSS